MSDLVTLDDARNHLRTDSTADDAWLELWITAISQAVLLWLKDDWRAYVLMTDSNGDVITDSAGEPLPVEDSPGSPVVKPIVRAAVLAELAQQYRFRDGSGAAAVPSHWGHGYTLGAGATSLLTSLRKTTVK